MLTHCDSSPTPADVAAALVERLRTDPRLADALTVREAWEAGYVAKLLVDAQRIAHDHGDLSGSTLDTIAALDAAVETADPAGPLTRIETPLDPVAVGALVDLVVLQAHVRGLAESLERRVPGRSTIAR